jgi:cytochrome c-type biogenesis protein CcmH
MRLVISLSLALALLCGAAPVVLGADHGPGTTPQPASLPDIEDEVMCPSCGTPLELAFSPQAERERRFIRQQITRGKSKEQIKQALVDEYGREVLALPDDSGFDLAAYLVPAAALGIAAALLALGLVRWRRERPRGAADTAAPLTAAERERIDQDMTRYEV